MFLINVLFTWSFLFNWENISDWFSVFNKPIIYGVGAWTKSATDTIWEGRTDTRVCCQIKGYKEDVSPSMLLDNKL